MKLIRILVVDDCSTYRRFIIEVLKNDPKLQIVGLAEDGNAALEKIKKLNPDIVLLDLEMPVLDGIGVLKHLNRTQPSLPVILFSSLTKATAEEAFKVFETLVGPYEYLPKPSQSDTPSNLAGLTNSITYLNSHLIPKIKMLCSKHLQSTPSNAYKIKPQQTAYKQDRPIEIVVIGISTGGPKSLIELFPKLPADLPIPIILVQHMPAVFTTTLAEKLNDCSQFPVQEAKHGDILKDGMCWVAPGNYHIQIASEAGISKLQLNRNAPVNHCRPAVDVLLESVVKIYGAGTLAIIMTGMGTDGLRGCELVNKAGGQIIAQDQASSTVWGMPKCIAEAGLADKIVPLNQIAKEITQRINKSRV